MNIQDAYILGYIPTYECCHDGVLEAKNESLEAVLTYVDLQCVALCNLTLLDDLASVLATISDLHPLRICGTPHYMSIISMCWGNVTAESSLYKIDRSTSKYRYDNYSYATTIV